MGKTTQAGSAEKEQKKRKSLISFFKRKKGDTTKQEKEKSNKPSEDVKAFNVVAEIIKEDANKQNQGKTASQNQETRENIGKLKKNREKTKDSTSGEKTKEKSVTTTTKKDQSTASEKATKINQVIQDRKEAYNGYKDKIGEWKKAKNKHSLFNSIINMHQQMKDKDDELSSYTEDERRIIINASGSANVVKEFENISSTIKEKFANRQQLQKQVHDNRSVYDMVMHVGKVGQERRDLLPDLEAVLNKEDEEAINDGKDDAEKQKIREKLEETREQRLENKYVDSVKGVQKSEPTTGQKVLETAKKGGSFLLKIEEWISEIFGNTSGSYSDISDLIEDKGTLEKKIEELRLAHKVNADPPEIGDMEFDAMDGIGCGFAAFNFIKTLVETIKAAVDAIKNQNIIDQQENALLFRDFFGKALDLIGNVIDFAGPWIDMVPFLGSCLSILQNAGGIAKASMELVFAGKNRYTVHQSQKKLKEKLAQKKKACLEGNHGMDSTLFDITDFSEEGIRKRREILLAYVGLHTDIKKNQKEIDDNQFNGKNFYERTLNRLDTSIFHRKSKENVASGYGEVNEKLAAKMWETKKAHREKTDTSVQEHDEYKSKIHAMEALDLLNEYEVENALAHRQNLKMRTNGFDLATSATKLVGNVLKLSGEICTATGVGALAGGALLVTGSAIKTVVGLIEATKGVGSFLNERLENNSQRGKNKEYVRNEMGTALFEKMDVLATIFGENKTINADTKDFAITKMKNDFDYIVGVRKGSDMRVSSIMKANTRGEIIDSLSSIFSQDGN